MLDRLVPPPDGLTFPTGAEIVTIEAADGVKLRSVFLKPAAAGASGSKSSETACRGTVFVLHGRAEYIEKYGEVFAKLLERGFAIASLDWRGQGGSERQLRNPRKGHVEDYDDYLLDLDALIAEARHRAMPEPYGVLAHSTGGAIALLALARAGMPFHRAMMTSPLVGIARLPSKTGVRLLARLLSSIGLSSLFIPTGGPSSVVEKPFEGNPLTGDPIRYALGAKWVAAAPELALGDPTIGWADATFEALARFEEEDFGQANRTPILMLIAGDDAVVDSKASAALAQRMRSTSAITLRGARHEILMERDSVQAEFWAAFDAFMQLKGAAAMPALVSTERKMVEQEISDQAIPEIGGIAYV